MRSLLHRVAVIGAFGLALFLAAKLFSKSGDRRLPAAKMRVDDACRAVRRQPGQEEALVCRVDEFGPLTFEIRNRARVKVNDARAHIRRGDARAAEAELGSAIDDVRALDRRGALGDVMAAEIVSDVLDILEAQKNENVLDAKRVLGDVDLESSSHPFQSFAANEMWHTAHYRETRYPDAPDFSAADLADKIEQERALFDEMAAATRARDVDRCTIAAAKLPPPTMGPTVGARYCVGLAKVVAVGERLRAARR